jgi:hypothetical protein
MPNDQGIGVGDEVVYLPNQEWIGVVAEVHKTHLLVRWKHRHDKVCCTSNVSYLVVQLKDDAFIVWVRRVREGREANEDNADQVQP